MGCFVQLEMCFICQCIGPRIAPKKYAYCRGSNEGQRSAGPLLVDWYGSITYYKVLTSEGSLFYSDQYPSIYCCSYATCVCIGSIGGLWLVPVVCN